MTAEDVKRARLAGMNGHLAKPISMEQLKRVLSGSLPGNGGSGLCGKANRNFRYIK